MRVGVKRVLVVVAVVVTSGLAIVGENRLADPNAARRGP